MDNTLKVCLINPPDNNEERADGFEYKYNSFTVPHVGLGYIYSYLTQNNIYVEIYECLSEQISFKNMAEIVNKQNFNLVGITVYEGNMHMVARLASLIKKTNPNVIVFLGGCHATIMYDIILKNFDIFDFCVIGEGELTCLEIAQAIIKGNDYKNVSGIAYKADSGEVVRNPPRSLIENISDLPFPFRKFISEKGIATVITSRGCYGNCIFCPTKVQYSYYKSDLDIRFRTADDVCAEIFYLIKKRNVKYINFDDDNFLCAFQSNIIRIEKIVSFIKNSNLEFRFSITARANDILTNKELLVKLKEIGLEYVFVGIESFSQRQLNFFRKNIKEIQNIEAIKYLCSESIKIDLGFLYLDPYTNIDEILYNLTKLKELEIHKHMYLSCRLLSMFSPVITVYKSDFYHQLKKDNLISSNAQGYKFVNEEVSLYYNICYEWSKKIAPLHSKYYLIQKAVEIKNENVEIKLIQTREELILLDIDFLINLCFDIKLNIINENTIGSHFNNYYVKLKELENKYMLIQDDLENRISKMAKNKSLNYLGGVR